MNNTFDSSIITFLNSFSQQSKTFDLIMLSIAYNNLLKGGVIIFILWWVWFREGEKTTLDRDLVLSTIIACFISLFLARSLALLLPFKTRPLHNPSLHFRLPYGLLPTTLEKWSAFPSDHAALFFTLTTGIFFISKTLGSIGLIYTFFVICLPRVYLGLHYPTDILAGACVGICIAYLSRISIVRARLTHRIQQWMDEHPGPSYAYFFILTYQIATLFNDARALGHFILTLLGLAH